jgi:hypothetical protein
LCTDRLVAEEEEERIRFDIRHLEQKPGRPVYIGASCDGAPVVLRDRAEAEIRGPILGNHEVGATGADELARGALEPLRDRAECDDGRNTDRDTEHREQRSHALPEEVLDDERGQRHRPERGRRARTPHPRAC